MAQPIQAKGNLVNQIRTQGKITIRILTKIRISKHMKPAISKVSKMLKVHNKTHKISRVEIRMLVQI